MRPFLWLLLISLATTPVLAESKKSSIDQRVGEGMMMVLKGEKEKAWNLLFPEAKAGNVVAMYQLGVLMMKSPEYENNLEKAKKFFSAAAERGHKGSAAMLLQVERMMTASGELPSIAGMSGLPVPKDIEAAKEAYSRAQQQVGRFVGNLRSVAPKATIKTFISDNSTAIKDLVEIANQAKARFGDKVEFEYYVLIDQSNWDPKKVFTQANQSMPITGFRPDLNGVIARKYGVRTTPSIVLIPENGTPKILSDAQSVITELSSVIR